MTITCTSCSTAFQITNEDTEFLQMLSPVIAGTLLSLPEPTQCPDCRQQRRLAEANQVNLYERKCDLTGASIISNFHASSPYKVYRQEDWYSDKWDPFEYGRAYDFSRSFFEQWQELSLAVPRPAMHRGFQYDENAEYTNYAGKNKNCYLIFDSDENWDCYYSYSLQRSKSCMDCFRVRDSELCYNAIDSIKSYNSAFIQDCDNCSDSMFLKNCIGCKNCLMCSNLKNKEYYVENKQVTKKEFENMRTQLTSYKTLQAAKERFEKLKLEYPQKYMQGIQNENVVGNYLTHCKDAYSCFDSNDLWDCRYVNQAFMTLKNCMDIQQCGDAENCYESCYCGYNAHSLLFSTHCLGEPAELLYSAYSPHSKNLFGCIGVMHKQYCILNKQYTKEEYEELVPKIVEHMKEAKQWGQPLPIELSTFAYNETIAQWNYPMSKAEVEEKGWRWLDGIEKQDQYMGPKVELPDNIADVTDEVVTQILTCEATNKQYKIIPQELKLYRQMKLPLPRRTFFQRNLDRIALRSSPKLYSRNCAKCSKAIQTTYTLERPETVYCERCYLKSIT